MSICSPAAADVAAPDVSIVMPCLNEATSLAICIQRARDALRILKKTHGLYGEIIVVDNGSTDESCDLARAHGVKLIKVDQRGYGSALIGGLTAADGQFLVIGDCDNTYDFLECVPMVEALLRGADICMGTRFRGAISPGAMPWQNRYIGNPVLSATLRLLFNTPVSDAHCGLRALTANCFERLSLRATGMEFASEMVLKAALQKFRIEEVPVTLRPSHPGRTPHLRPWRDGWRHLRYMLMLSPVWLFLVPAGILGAAGCLILFALLINPDLQMVKVAGLPFGDHWMIIASAMVIVAHQASTLGLVALLYGIREGYRDPPPIIRPMIKYFRLEYLILAGMILIIWGTVIFADVLRSWARAGFGTLDAIRPIVAAVTLVIVGFQTFFGGFILSIIGGNESRIRLEH